MQARRAAMSFFLPLFFRNLVPNHLFSPPLSSLGRASRAELMRVREIAKAGNKVRRGETTACPVALLVDPKSCQVPHHWSVHERVPGNGYMIWQPWRGGDGNFSPLHSEVGG